MEAIGLRGSSSTVGRLQHNIEEALVGRHHQSSISSMLVRNALA